MAQEQGRVRVVVTLEGRIIRCGCGDPATHPGVVCPTPLKVEELGELGRGEGTL